MNKTLTQSKAEGHIVWLDVVRLVAMFTVVCCHSADPFNFYPGTSPDIADIKFWVPPTAHCFVPACHCL